MTKKRYEKVWDKQTGELLEKYLIKENVITMDKFLEFKALADSIINPAQEILPRTYDKELEDYHKWIHKNL